MKTLIALLLLASTAHAQQTWDYTGSIMTGTQTGIGESPTPVQITGDMVLAQALNPNQANQIVTPTSFNFGGPLQPEWTSNAGSPVFSLTTVNGAITAWNISMFAYAPGTEEMLQSTQGGDHFESNTFGGACGWQGNCGAYNAVSMSGGVWTDPQTRKVQAPELDWSQFATAMTLLCGTALVINTRRSR